ncbi:hypothetical protein JCM8547_006428 [Rhodosporidiobolus lusitaniae]
MDTLVTEPATVYDRHLHLDPESEEYRRMEKKLVRKIDLRILPLICLSYLLNYLDRTSLGNARTLNQDKPGESLVEALNLKGMRYNIVVAVFFIPYVLLEFPSNTLLKYFTPSRHLARIMFLWGVVSCATAGVHNYGGLIAARLALGIAEAGFFPGVIYYLSFWYKTSERATRMAIFSASVSLAGAFGGLIATGVSYMSGKGGLYGWQWLFILEGIPAILCAVLVYFFLPDYPETAKFLTPEERAFATHRMGPFAPKGTDKHWDSKAAISCFKSWHFWAFAVTYFGFASSLNVSGYFTPTLLSAMGYSGVRSQLFSVAPNAFGFFVIIANAWWSDRRKQRTHHILAGIALVAAGYLLIGIATAPGVRYVGVFFIACTNAAVMPFLAWRTATVTGATATGLATAFIVAISNSSGAAAPFLFPSTDSPRYTMGCWVSFGLLMLGAVLVCALWFALGGSSEYRGSSSILALPETAGLEGEKTDEAKKEDEASRV